jgi:SAM-dependent methyltransferase
VVTGAPYYRRDLALVHHRGFGFHAHACAPGILELLEPVRERDGVVVATGAEDISQVVLPDDPLPPADAVVSVGHVLNYLPDESAIDRALVAVAQALRPGGVLAIDLCDLEWGEARRDALDLGRVSEDWAIITKSSVPSRNRFVREMTTFLRNEDGSWRRDDERHDNVLIDTTLVPALLGNNGLQVTVASSFGTERLPVGLRALIGHRPA